MQLFNRYFVVIFCLAMSTHALAARIPTSAITTNNAVNLSPATVGSTPLNPVITGFSSTACVSPGSSITVNGRNFGNQKTLSLLAYVNDGFNNGDDVGVTTIRNIALKVTNWQDTKVMAYMPASGTIEPGSLYPIGIKNTNSSIWLSNIDKKILICQSKSTRPQIPKLPIPDAVVQVVEPPKPTVPAHPDTTPEISDKPEPVSDDVTTTTTDTTAEDSGDNTQVVLPDRSGSLINRQLPSTPPKISVLPPIDPTGNAIAEPNELLVVSSNMEEAKQLAKQLRSFGLSAKKRKVLKSLGLVITTYRVPTDIDLQQTTINIRQAYPNTWTDLNHRYTLQADNRTTQHAKKLINWQKSDRGCGKGLRIGLVDTEVNTAHPALKTQKIILYSILSPGIKKAKTTHATAIATLLVGSSESSSFSGLLPSAELYSASVFRQRDNNHADTTAEWIVSAIDWLLSQDVQVINMSVGGPRNLLVDIALQRTIESGVPVIAAAGNGGSKATAVYPAAQPGVIAVTAVDSEMELYSEANKGKYIDFAAPGVDIWAGNEKGTGKFVTGTSFAVPFVTAAIANIITNSDPKQAYLQLQANATDLGVKGKDEQFGWGMLQASGSCL